MKKVAGNVSLKDWSLDSLDELSKKCEEIALKAAAEAIEIAMQDSETYVYLPYTSEGDPLELWLHTGFYSTDSDEPPTYEFNLREAVESAMEECKTYGGYQTPLTRFSAALRDLADEIDTAVRVAKEKGLRE